MVILNKKVNTFVLGVFLVFFFSYLSSFFGFQEIWFDFLLSAKSSVSATDKNIVLITIDENTIKKYSEPTFWTRSRYESLLNDIEIQKPKAVVFDYYFNSKSNPENVDWDLIQSLSDLSTKKIDNLFYTYNEKISNSTFLSSIDRDFITSVRKGGNVFFPYLASIDSGNKIKSIKIDTFPNLKAHSRGGYVNTLIDADGVIRRFPLLDSDLYQPLSASVAGYVSKNEYKLNPSNKYYINFSSLPKKGFDIIPFELAYNGVYEDKAGKKINLKDKIVIVGDYGEIFGDYYKVSVGRGKLMSGMEILAYEIKNLLDGSIISDIGPQNRIVTGITLFVLTLIAFSFISSYLINFILYILTNAVLIFLDFRFMDGGLYMSYMFFFPIILASYLAPLFFNLKYSLKEKYRLKKFFSKFVGKNIVDLIIKKPDLNLDGEKREVTIFFADIRNFTTLSEKLTPEKVVSMLNMIFKEANEIIFKNNGTLDKYIGDAIMAFWGAPIEIDNHAILASITALEFQNVINKIEDQLKKDFNLEIFFRIGLNTGQVTVGSIGTEDFADYTVIGDNVNIASRLESINKVYNTGILVTEDTFSKLDSDFLLREIDIIKLKGKENPVTIYELLDYKGQYQKNEHIDKIIKNHVKGLALYRKGKFLDAKAMFKLNKDMGDPVAKAFIDRINSINLKKNETWTGIWEFSEK